MMSAHRPHPIKGEWPSDSGQRLYDPDDAILYDTCDRCAEQAANLGGLDDTKLTRLYWRMLEVETGDRDVYATRAEGRAAGELARCLGTAARLFPNVDVYQGRQPHTFARMSRTGGEGDET